MKLIIKIIGVNGSQVSHHDALTLELFGTEMIPQIISQDPQIIQRAEIIIDNLRDGIEVPTKNGLDFERITLKEGMRLYTFLLSASNSYFTVEKTN